MPYDQSFPFAVSLRFSGTLVEGYKEMVIRALIDRDRPSWLKVAHMRSNGNGHTIRLSFKITDDERNSFATAIKASPLEPRPCGDGVLKITRISSVLIVPTGYGSTDIH